MTRWTFVLSIITAFWGCSKADSISAYVCQGTFMASPPGESTPNGSTGSTNTKLGDEQKNLESSPTLTIGKALEGYIQSAGTASFSFRVAERGAYTVETTGYTHVKLALFGPESQTSEVSLGRSTKDLVNQTLVADLNPGTYTVKVKHAQAGGSGEFTVKVTLASHQSVPRDEVAPLPPIQAGKMSKKLALLVGVDKYKAVTDLQGCVNDIKDMKDLLIGNFGFLADDVLELSNEQATHDNIITAFNDHLIQRADEGAIVVFHFSGHGSQMKDAEGGDELFDHLDETLVTHDSRSAPDRFDIRDDELNGLFRQLVAKNTAVTFVLDSCHSGSGIKAAGQGFPRRVDADDRDPPPAKAWELSTKGSKAKDTRFEDLDYVLISGCRAEEVSYELDLNGIRRGALTHYLTKAIRDAGKPAVTYADIMEDVKAQVKSDNPTQNPQVEGKLIKNFVFSDESSQPRRYVRVSRVGNSLRLPVGLVQGMTEDSIFDIYRHDADDMDFDDRQRAATSVKLTKVAAFDSEAELTGDKPVEVADGWKAVLRDVALSSTKFPIYFLKVEDGTGYFVDPSRSVEAIAPNSTLERVRNDLLQNSRLSIVDSGNQARLLFGKVDGHFRVFRPGGIEIAKRADSTKFEDLRDWALGQCRHWSAFHQNLAISNPGTERFRVSLDIEGAQAAQASDVDRVPLQRLNEGAEVRFRVTNDGAEPMFFSLVNFNADGSVEVLWPENGDGERLAPGSHVLLPPKDERAFDASISEVISADVKSVVDRLKVIATSEQARFEILEMDTPKSFKRPKHGKWTTCDRAVEIFRQ